MTANPQPPPEAVLIRASREAPPHMSMRQAARAAGISESRWRQLEAGGKPYRGRWEPETAPADTLARMAQAVGITGDHLTEAGRADAAAELAVLPAGTGPQDYAELARGYRELAERSARMESKLDRLLRDREQSDKEDHHEQANGGRRAG